MQNNVNKSNAGVAISMDIIGELVEILHLELLELVSLHLLIFLKQRQNCRFIVHGIELLVLYI